MITYLKLQQTMRDEAPVQFSRHEPTYRIFNITPCNTPGHHCAGVVDLDPISGVRCDLGRHVRFDAQITIKVGAVA